MLYNIEHEARIRESLGGDGEFARKMIGRGIDAILQRLKGSYGPMQVQSYRFKKQYFTADQARQWLKNNKLSTISFEPASS